MSTLTPTVTAAIDAVISTAKRLGHSRVTSEGSLDHETIVAHLEERLAAALTALEAAIGAAVDEAYANGYRAGEDDCDCDGYREPC